MNTEWVTVNEAAQRLDLSTKTIYRQLWAGTFPCRARQVSRVWRINAADLDALVRYIGGEA